MTPPPKAAVYEFQERESNMEDFSILAEAIGLPHFLNRARHVRIAFPNLRHSSTEPQFSHSAGSAFAPNVVFEDTQTASRWELMTMRSRSLSIC